MMNCCQFNQKKNIKSSLKQHTLSQFYSQCDYMVDDKISKKNYEKDYTICGIDERHMVGM